jgi:beta-glucosidase
VAIALAAAVSCTAASAPLAAADVPLYLDPSAPPQERAADLVLRMTPQEKASQMNSSRAPAIPRLGVRAYGWWNEAAHGVSREQTNDGASPPDLTNTTSYPVSLSMGSTWDPGLVHRVAQQVSDEAREVVQNNTQDLNFYSPTVNLSRDPRWGRNDETYGEDPLLTSKLGAQYVNGMQGADQSGRPDPRGGPYLKTSTTIKHYALNNSEFNRTTGSSDVDQRSLREYYTKQFRDIINSSHPGSIMSSYNSVNGVPAAASTDLMDTLARKTYGFRGFFTSDCDATYEIQHGHHWQPQGFDHPLGPVERSAAANAAGEDLDCDQGYHDDENFGNTLPQAVQQRTRTPNGPYDESYMDSSLVRLFTTRIKLGEFDPAAANPWVQQARARVPRGTWQNSDANRAVTETPQRLDLARRAADNAVVLLKNDPGPGGSPMLPLRVPKSGPFRVAVVGDTATNQYLGGYSSAQGPAGQAKSVNDVEGLQRAIRAINPQAQVDHLPGTVPGGGLNQDSVAKSANYDAAVVTAGTDDNTAKEEKDRTTLQLPAPQTDLINGVAARNPNTAVSLRTVGPVDVTSFEPHVRSILWSSYNGMRGGEALADVLTGAQDPSGHLPFTWYRDDSQLPPIGDYGIRPEGGRPGRTYQYFRGPVSYPFGHGLSYAKFTMSGLRTDRAQVDANGTVNATAQVTNNSDTAGSTVAQLYATTPDAAARQRPAERLAGFAKVALQPHETRTVSFPVAIGDLVYFDGGRWHVDDGTYQLRLGRSAADTAATTAVQVSGQPQVVPQHVSATPHAAGDPAGRNDGRVAFPQNTPVQPRLTVSMTDGTLRGYDPEHGEAPLPPGMAVEYRSDRPDVVSADPRGGLSTRGPGIATVTATVRDGAVSRSTTFVVAVR